MIEREAAFWANQAEDATMKGFSPDLDKPFRASTVRAIWDDSALDFMIRGRYVKKILDYCAHKPQSDCLELCCGTGMLALAASKQGAKVKGIDVSPHVLQIAEKYARNSGIPAGRLDYQICDLNRASLPRESYDVVFVWDGLHHIAEIEHLVREVRATLRAGGVFVVHDHAKSDPGIRNTIRLGLVALLYLVVPTDPGVLARFKAVFRRTSPGKEPSSADHDQCLDSPFEDVSGENIVKSIEANFSILEFERYMSLPGSLYAKAGQNLQNRSKTVHALLAFDRLLCSLHILSPEYFFIVAQKAIVSSND